MFGPLLIIIAAILWALDGLLRRNLYSLPPLTIVTAEHAIGLVLLLPILWQFRHVLTKLTTKEWGMVGLVSLLSGLVGTVLFTAALLQVQFIPMSIVFLLQKLQPIFVFATATIILREKVNKSQLVWSAIALLAGFFMTFPSGKIAIAGNTNLAALMALGAAAAWGTSTVFSRWLLLRLPANATTALRFLLTTAIGLVALLFFPSQQALTAINFTQVLNLFIIAFSTGMVALAIYYQGLKRTNATTATILELFFPVLAVIIDAKMYHTSLNTTQYLAAAALLFSAWQIAKHNQQLLVVKFVSRQQKGDGRGKKMGFPTLNLEIPANLNLAHGIYAAHVQIAGHRYKGALHFGPIPTFDKPVPTIEIFLLDTDSIPTNLIENQIPITVTIEARLREVILFSKKEDLTKQISQDVAAVSKLLTEKV